MQDSYQKYANDFFGGYISPFLKYVEQEDLDEIKVAFSVNVSHLDCADNFRVFSLGMTKEYEEKKGKGCCGFWDTQCKCLSGRIYWIGCNYGH